MNENRLYIYLKKAPLLFSLIAVFHIGITAFSIWEFQELPFNIHDWQHPLLMITYTVSWLLVCTLKKWTAYLYLLLTVMVLIFHFIIPAKLHWQAVSAPLFPADLLFSFFILAFFKKFER